MIGRKLPDVEERIGLPLLAGLILFLLALAIFSQKRGEHHFSLGDAGAYVSIPGHEYKARELAALFNDAGYTLNAVRTGDQVPHIVLTSLPDDLRTMTQVERRKRLFFRIMLPLILTVNQEILAERAEVLALQPGALDGTLNETDTDRLAALLQKYSVEDTELDIADQLNVLLTRINVIPVDLALAQAAEESAWGMSRFARDGNALFGQWTWDPKAGLEPREKREGQDYAVRAFRSLLDSVRAYAFNLNTHWAYADFRARRKDTLDGKDLAAGLLRYSERREAYIGSLRALIRVNQLTDFAEATLGPPDPVADALRSGVQS